MTTSFYYRDPGGNYIELQVDNFGPDPAVSTAFPIIILQVVLSLLFLAIGSMTVAGRKFFVEAFRHYGYPQWFRFVIGSLEVLGGLGLFLGIWLHWLAALTSTGLALILLGAVFSQMRTKESLQRVDSFLNLKHNVRM